ncbi:hypothetical protein STEG23_004853, partial [Scotinomys teguina]
MKPNCGVNPVKQLPKIKPSPLRLFLLALGHSDNSTDYTLCAMPADGIITAPVSSPVSSSSAGVLGNLRFKTLPSSCYCCLSVLELELEQEISVALFPAAYPSILTEDGLNGDLENLAMKGKLLHLSEKPSRTRVSQGTASDKLLASEFHGAAQVHYHYM